MSKQEAELNNSLSIFWLKKYGYLELGQHYGGIKWSYGESGNESSIGFNTTIGCNEPDSIRLRYTYTNKRNDEISNMDFKVELTSTTCNYGGKRYWFVCPLSKSNIACFKRIGVLYSIGKYYGCRHCGDITYSAQKQGGQYRHSVISIKDIEKAENDVKRYYYNNKPTRKYLRFMKLQEKMDDSLIMMFKRIDKRFGRFVRSEKK